MRWLLKYNVGRTLGWAVLLMFAAVATNLAGIGLIGDVEGWNGWLDAHAKHLLIWRWCLYGVTVYGWLWMRRHLRERDTSAETHQRLLRAEIGALAVIALLEFSLLWHRP